MFTDDNTIGMKLLHALLPAILYFAASWGISWIVQFLTGTTEQFAAQSTVLTALLSVPVLILYIRRDRSVAGKTSFAVKSPAEFHVGFTVCAACAGAAFSWCSSILMRYAGMYEMFSNETQEVLYAAPLWLQIVGLGIIVPVAEELLYRVFIYGRLLQIMQPVSAAVLVSVLFAAGHGNIIQMVYAFPASLILVWCMRRGTVAAAIAFHIGANLLSVFWT